MDVPTRNLEDSLDLMINNHTPLKYLNMTIDNSQIGDYKFEKTLGRGTFGKVKQGVHIHTQ
jgi:hypothetical protein